MWMRTAPERLTPRARRMLQDERNDLFLSAVTPWEIAIKVALGKLRLPCPVEEFISARTVATRVTPLPITQLHAIESAELPQHHRDPFDRVLVAQARLETTRLMSTDEVFASYDVDVVWARR